MNREIAVEWAEVLKSGAYKQGKTVLRKGNEFCCLGVLCDMYAQKHPGKGRWEKNNDAGCNIYAFVTEEGDDCSYLPPEVLEWAGISLSNGTFRPSEATNSQCLVDLNDTGSSFSQIADIILTYSNNI